MKLSTQYVIVAFLIICIIIASISSKDIVGGKEELSPTTQYFDIYKKSNRPLLALHYTTWCKFCQKMKPEWEKAKKKLKADFTIVEYDEDKHPHSHIKTVPALFKYTPSGLKKYSLLGPDGNTKYTVQDIVDFANS